MDHNAIKQFINNEWDNSIIPELIEYIKIPAKSPHFDANWQANGYLEQVIQQIAKWCEAHAPRNMQLNIMRLEGRTPIIYMDIPGNIEKTVLLYGHCDKQPEMSGWDEDLGPWIPKIKGDKLYGRGGADDGYAAFASLTAINALQQQNIPHAHCKIIIESCEESGSYDLPFYIEALNDKLGEPDLVVCLDSGCGNYDQMWMTTSLRGNVVGELSVEIIKEGVHSGNASGIVADSFRVARQLISRIEDEVTGEITLKALHQEIPKARIEQAEQAAEVLGDQVFSEFPFHSGVQAISSDKTQLVLNRTWRPALSITGAGGFPAIADAGNVSRPITSFKLSMRIPPECDPAKADAAIQHALTDKPPYNAKVIYTPDEGAMGWNAPPLADWLKVIASEASEEYFGQPAMYMGEGGTIPFMGMLGESFPKAQFMITGVLGPKSNAHGPNEFLHIPTGKKLTGCVAMVIAKMR